MKYTYLNTKCKESHRAPIPCAHFQCQFLLLEATTPIWNALRLYISGIHKGTQMHGLVRGCTFDREICGIQFVHFQNRKIIIIIGIEYCSLFL